MGLVSREDQACVSEDYYNTVLVKLGFCSSEGWDIVTLTHINKIVNED